MTEKRTCPGCNGPYTVNRDGRLRSHKGDSGPVLPCSQEPRTDSVSDPAPTVEPMGTRCDDDACGCESAGDTAGDQCYEPRCTCEGHGGPEHELAIIAYGDDDVADVIAYEDRQRDDLLTVPADHQPGRPPAQAEIDHWQRPTDFERKEMASAHWQEQARAAADRHLAATAEDILPAALDAFASPAPYSMSDAFAASALMPTTDAFVSPGGDGEPELSVSGQPPARYEWHGSQNRGYLVTLPDTGDFHRYKNGKPKGITRATTFNKAASDSKAINDWGKRNIVIGASRRRDVLLRAHGLTHENDRRELEKIVAELEEAAGAKVGSDLGSYLHKFTEYMDAGLKTWRDAPEEFQGSLRLYEQALADAGLEPVQGLIERTTMITEFGGVAGTFDRIFYHRPSETYLIGDLKTGKTMEYAMNETETQLWIYAHGVNQNGIYDWNTDTWHTPLNAGGPDFDHVHEVREDVGVIIHMPVQGELAGQVMLDHADLEAGARHAELCHRNRTAPKSKVRAFEAPLPARPLTWEEQFALVTSGEHANQLWRMAKAQGIEGIRLNDLIAIARETLTSRG